MIRTTGGANSTAGGFLRRARGIISTRVIRRHSQPGVTRGRRGFSLVELLVVIGVITILIGMLMPVLVRVRIAAQSTACKSNLRQIGLAMTLRAGEHRGFVPMAGLMNDLPVPLTPAAIDDADETRYLYFTDSGTKRPAPLQAALAPYLGRPMRTDSRADLETDLAADSPVKRIFTCPAQGQGQGLPGMMVAGGVPYWEAPLVVGSYAYNEGVVGYLYNDPDRRLRGHITKARRPTETVLLGDGLPRTEYAVPYIAWFPSPAGLCTLADAADNANGTGTAGTATEFDYPRHRGRMNLLYVDGHVDSILMDEDSLKAAILAPE